MTAKAESSTVVRVLWSAPVNRTALVGYFILYRIVGEDDPFKFANPNGGTENTQHDLIIEDLVPNTAYEVCVNALHSQTLPKWPTTVKSEPVIIRTLTGEPCSNNNYYALMATPFVSRDSRTWVRDICARWFYLLFPDK